MKLSFSFLLITVIGATTTQAQFHTTTKIHDALATAQPLVSPATAEE